MNGAGFFQLDCLVDDMEDFLLCQDNGDNGRATPEDLQLITDLRTFFGILKEYLIESGKSSKFISSG